MRQPFEPEVHRIPLPQVNVNIAFVPNGVREDDVPLPTFRFVDEVVKLLVAQCAG